MFIANSYYCTDELSEWCDQLERLTTRIQKEKRAQSNRRNKVLLLGSPVYSHNSKVLFFINKVKIEMYMQKIALRYLYMVADCGSRSKKGTRTYPPLVSPCFEAYWLYIS